MSFISFHYNKNLKYALIYWALEIIIRVIMHYKWEYFQIVENEAYNEYFLVILEIIADLFSGFLVLYIYYSFKKGKIPKNLDIDEKDLVMDIDLNEIKLIEKAKNTYHKSECFVFKFIGVVVLYFLCKLSFFIFYKTNDQAKHDNISHKFQKDVINQIDILARYFLSIYFLKGVALKHYKFSIIFISIAICILLPVDILSMYNNSKIDANLTWIFVGILSIRAILFPAADTLIKSIFNNDYLIPEKLMFLRGCGEFILLIIITPILFFTLDVKNDLNFKHSNKEDIIYLILVLISYTIGSFIKGILLLKLIYYFSSQSVSFLIISESVTGSIYYIIDSFKSEEEYEIIISFIEVIGILMTTFATLVFDEIIVIYICGLEKDAVNEIEKRGIDEIKYIKKEKIRITDNEENEEKEEEEEDIKLSESKVTIYE